MTSGSRRWVLALAATGLLAVPHGLRAQAAPLVVEVRTGASVPLADFEDGTGVGEGASPGVSFGVRFAASGSGRRTLYAGFAQHRFGCEDAGCPADGRYVATTLEAGIRLNLLTRGHVIPWLQVGGVTARVESPGVPGSPPGVSERGYGGELGLGIHVGTWSAVALSPGVRVSSTSVDLPGGTALRMRTLIADLGLSLAF